jgi:hypothetical protein
LEPGKSYLVFLTLTGLPGVPDTEFFVAGAVSGVYGRLWEVVQTSWHRDESEYTTLAYLLVQHANHILMNQFHEQLGLGPHDWESPALTSERVIRHGVDVVIDGRTVTGAEIDTNPFVYAIGADLPSGGTFTAVIPREHLQYINLKFTRRQGV